MNGNLLIITGALGIGKTTLLQRLVEHKTNQGVKIGGLLTPKRFEAGKMTGIYAIDLQSRRSRLLASKNPNEILGFAFCDWTFDPAVLNWGNQVLARAKSAPLLIIDEIGPMELEHNQGWTNAITILEKGAHPKQTMIAVVRPECLAEALRRFPVHQTISVAGNIDGAFEQLCSLSNAPLD